MIYFLHILIMLFIVGNTKIQNSNQKESTKINIKANNMEVHTKKNIIIFSGDVIIIKKNISIQSDKIIMYYINKKDVNSYKRAEGDLQSINIYKIEAIKNIIFKSGNQTAIGNYGIFYVILKKIILKGNIILMNKNSIAKGCKLISYIESGKFTLESCNNKKRIYILIHPKG